MSDLRPFVPFLFVSCLNNGLASLPHDLTLRVFGRCTEHFHESEAHVDKSCIISNSEEYSSNERVKGFGEEQEDGYCV